MRRCVPATPAAVVGAERAAGVGANGGDQSTNTLVVAKLSVTTVDPDDEVTVDRVAGPRLRIRPATDRAKQVSIAPDVARVVDGRRDLGAGRSTPTDVRQVGVANVADGALRPRPEVRSIAHCLFEGHAVQDHAPAPPIVVVLERRSLARVNALVAAVRLVASIWEGHLHPVAVIVTRFIVAQRGQVADRAMAPRADVLARLDRIVKGNAFLHDHAAAPAVVVELQGGRLRVKEALGNAAVQRSHFGKGHLHPVAIIVARLRDAVGGAASGRRRRCAFSAAVVQHGEVLERALAWVTKDRVQSPDTARFLPLAEARDHGQRCDFVAVLVGRRRVRAHVRAVLTAVRRLLDVDQAGALARAVDVHRLPLAGAHLRARRGG